MTAIPIEYRTALTAIKHISHKLLQKAFIKFFYYSKKTRSHLLPEKSITFYTFQEKHPSSSSKIIPLSFKFNNNDRSPQNTSTRLFNNAQEIENRKNEIRKSLVPEYPFTPRLSSGTQKWLNSKSKKNLQSAEEVAIVSGSRMLNFTNISAEVKGAFESKIPTPKSNKGKSRIFTSRLNRKSDIIIDVDKAFINTRRHNKSSSKAMA